MKEMRDEMLTGSGRMESAHRCRANLSSRERSSGRNARTWQPKCPQGTRTYVRFANEGEPRGDGRIFDQRDARHSEQRMETESRQGSRALRLGKALCFPKSQSMSTQCRRIMNVGARREFGKDIWRANEAYNDNKGPENRDEASR